MQLIANYNKTLKNLDIKKDTFKCSNFIETIDIWKQENWDHRD